MRILVACERSGKVRDAIRALGHDAVSCDLEETDAPGPHYKGDVRDILGEKWDGLIAHPVCKYLSVSGFHWVRRGRIEADGRPRAEHVEEGLAFARMFIDGPETAHIPRRITENPISVLSSLVRRPDQIINPYEFGDDASKATCLWLCGVAPLPREGSKFIFPRLVCKRCKWTLRPDVRWQVYKHMQCEGCGRIGGLLPRWSNQTDSGQNKLPPSKNRAQLRSDTYPGIARALALAITRGA